MRAGKGCLLMAVGVYMILYLSSLQKQFCLMFRHSNHKFNKTYNDSNTVLPSDTMVVTMRHGQTIMKCNCSPFSIATTNWIYQTQLKKV